MQLQEKRAKEQKMVLEMISLYCKRKHHSKGTLCLQCQALYIYATQRIEKCPMMAQKTFCSNCKVHCYRADMRAQMCAVMRFAGPRMLFVHPILAVHHLVDTIKQKRKSGGNR